MFISDLPVYHEELCFCFVCINIPTLTFPTLNLANSNFPNFEKLEYGNSNFPNFAQKYNSNFNSNFAQNI